MSYLAIEEHQDLLGQEEIGGGPVGANLFSHNSLDLNYQSLFKSPV